MSTYDEMFIRPADAPDYTKKSKRILLERDNGTKDISTLTAGNLPFLRVTTRRSTVCLDA